MFTIIHQIKLLVCVNLLGNTVQLIQKYYSIINSKLKWGNIPKQGEKVYLPFIKKINFCRCRDEQIHINFYLINVLWIKWSFLTSVKMKEKNKGTPRIGCEWRTCKLSFMTLPSPSVTSLFSLFLDNTGIIYFLLPVIFSSVCLISDGVIIAITTEL